MAVRLALLILLLTCSSAFGWGVVSNTPAPAGGGGYTEEVTDTFSSASDPPTGWTEDALETWVANASGYLTRLTDPYNDYIRYSTELTGVDHYVCFDLVTVNTSSVPGVAFRMLSDQTGTNYFYIVRNDRSNDSLDFRSCYNDGTDANCSTFHAETITDLASTDEICVAVEGTGVSTIFYYWLNPENYPPLKANATYTISSSNWDNAPNTTNGYADTGKYIGAADMGGADVTAFDNFSGGVE